MQSEYRVKRIYTEEDGGVVAKCYDILYGEDFEKYLGFPDDFDGKENASNLLQDSTYEMSDELRAEIEELFNVEEFNDEQDYDGYQFFDFDDDFDDEDDDEDEMNQRALAMMGKRESFNLREALNQIDLNTDNKYDLLNLYESCDLKENEKRALANIVYDQEDPRVIYDTLNNRYVSGEEIGMPERVKDGVIHEEIDDTKIKSIIGDYIKKSNGIFTDDSIYDIIEILTGETDIDKMPIELVNKVRDIVVHLKDEVIHESTDSTLQTCLNAWKKLEKNSPSYDEAIDLVTTAEQLVGYYIDRYEEEAYSTYLGNRGILSNVTPEMDKEIISLFKQITEIEWTGEYLEDNEWLDESNSIKEDTKTTFNQNIDLNDVVTKLSNILFNKTSHSDTDWIEVYPIDDAKKIENGESFIKLSIESEAGSKKASLYTNRGKIDVKFNNGSEAKCNDVDEIARFIAGELKINLEESFDEDDDQMIKEDKISDWDSTDSLGERYDINESKSIKESRPDKDINTTTNKVTIKYGNSVKEVETCKPIKVNKKQLDSYKDNYSIVDVLDESKSIKENYSTFTKKDFRNKLIDILRNSPKDEYGRNMYFYVGGITIKPLKDNSAYIVTILPNKDSHGNYTYIPMSDISNYVIDELTKQNIDCNFRKVGGSGRFTFSIPFELINESTPLDKSIRESSYKKGDRVELDNGMTGTVTKDFDWENEDQVSVEIDGTGEMRYPRSETLRDLRESDEETPYTKEEIERDLKSITHNFTDKEGELKCGFEEEKKFGVEILKQHYKVVETSGDDRRDGTWYHISFAEPIKK